MAINVEQNVPVWLAVGRIGDSRYVVDNSCCVQGLGVCLFS